MRAVKISIFILSFFLLQESLASTADYYITITNQVNKTFKLHTNKVNNCVIGLNHQQSFPDILIPALGKTTIIVHTKRRSACWNIFKNPNGYAHLDWWLMDNTRYLDTLYFEFVPQEDKHFVATFSPTTNYYRYTGTQPSSTAGYLVSIGSK